MIKALRNFAGLFLSAAIVTIAAPITYTDQALSSGSLGNSNFTNVLVTVTFAGDSGNASLGADGVWRNLVGTGTVTVAGLGTATFTDSMEAFDNPSLPEAAGIADTDAGPASVLDTFNNTFATYTLQTSIGPLSGSPFINPGFPFPTTSGALTINTAGDSTFTGITGVPEPGSASIVLAAGASLFLIVTVRRRAMRRN